MAKPTGFLEYTRQPPGERPYAERVQDWDSIYLPVANTILHEQAARCMDCGIPFCHKGRIINRMTTGCPINNLIPEWNDLVYRGLWREAYERLAKTNNFPEFTGLVCPAPCEASCTLGINKPAVTIKSIEYAIIDRAFEEGWVTPEIPEKRTGKKIAIIGSGPAGLSCADQLNRVGHHVTVYERADRIGGLLMYGIPNMKLEKGIVQRRVDLMASAGVEFITSCEVGKDVLVETLNDSYDAVVLCTGSTRPRNLTIPGRELRGIEYAMDFLHPNTKSLLDSQHADGNFISAAGKKVIVIGGGDTGTDCVGTSVRHGCESLVQFEIMERPPDDRLPQNPWPQWPIIYKLDYGQKEAKARFGDDPRTYSILTTEFLGNEQGQVTGLRTVDIVWEPDPATGAPFTPVAGSERTWEADMVLLALGYLGPEGGLLSQLDVETDERQNAQAEYGRFQTNIPHVFAAGDARRGQSLVVWAINEGRGAAREVDKWLMGETDLP